MYLILFGLLLCGVVLCSGIIKIEQADLSTSSLMFHAFHDILAITDNQGVGVWSLESGNQVRRNLVSVSMLTIRLSI